jgi:hypothetical protein
MTLHAATGGSVTIRQARLAGLWFACLAACAAAGCDISEPVLDTRLGSTKIKQFEVGV